MVDLIIFYAVQVKIACYTCNNEHQGEAKIYKSSNKAESASGIG